MQSNGAFKGVAALLESGVFLRTDGDATISFRDAAEDEFYKLYRDASENTLDVNKFDAGLNGRVIARFEDQGPDLLIDQSIVTREKGDARYPVIGDLDGYVKIDGDTMTGPLVIEPATVSDTPLTLRAQTTTIRFEQDGGTFAGWISPNSHERADLNTGAFNAGWQFTAFGSSPDDDWIMEAKYKLAHDEVLSENQFLLKRQADLIYPDTFARLLDTPPDYTGAAGLSVLVNATEDGVEFGQATPTIGDTLPNPAKHGQQHYLTVQPVGMYVYIDEAELGTGTSAQWVQQNGGGIVAPTVGLRRIAKFKPAASYAWTFGNGTNGRIINDTTVHTVGSPFGTMDANGTFTFDEAGTYEVTATTKYSCSNIDGYRSRGRGKVFFNGADALNQSEAVAYNRNIDGTNYNMNVASTGVAHWLGDAVQGDEVHASLAIEKEEGQGPTVDHNIGQGGTWIKIEKVADA